jgi:heme/copper-type cytochrome/quinol oxidase subunit 4
LFKTNRYVIENWSSPFIVGFVLLLIIAVALLAMGLDWLANELTYYAYFALVAGVVLQLVCFLRQGKTKRSEN